MQFRSCVLLLLLCSCVSYAAVQTDGPMVGAVTFKEAKVFLRTDSSARVQVEFSKYSNMSQAVRTDIEMTRYADDFTKIVTLSGLYPNTKYYYRVLVDQQPQQIEPFPSFVTFPYIGEDKEYSFGLLSDAGNDASNPAGVYGVLASFIPSFVVQIGDWDHRDPANLREMRKMHREVRGRGSAAGIDFSRYLAPRFPIFHVWDDHDYGMNDGDYTFAEKDSALQAFLEYFPLPDMPNPSAGLWHSFRYGKTEVFMLDTRSNRDPNDSVDDGSKSMLNGEGISNDQKTWLFDQLLASTAKWKFITSGSPFNPTCKSDDGWGAFNNERQEIVDFIADNSIKGVIVLSGDIHSGGGFDNGTNSGLIEMTVPHTNMKGPPEWPGYTTAEPGVWSEGIMPGGESAGFGWINVLNNPDRVELQVRGEQGDLRSSYTVYLDET